MRNEYLKDMNLLIVSHVVHYHYSGKFWAYAPYTREIDLWCDLFGHVTIAAPCRETQPPGDSEPFRRSNLSLFRQTETGGSSLPARLRQFLHLPGQIWRLVSAMRRVDAVHVRCPGNLGGLGVVLAPFFSKRIIAKYAGQWNGYPEEPFFYRLQRRILNSKIWSGPVTVYGQWPNQPSHVIPFFSSNVTMKQMERAQIIARSRKINIPLRVLFVGRLAEAKNVDVLISAVAELKALGISIECDIVGDGPFRGELEKMANQLGVCEFIHFAGGVPSEEVSHFYEQADVLVLASRSEGWPKVLVEGMSFGLICIGSNRGLVPTILDNGRGFTVSPRDKDALVSLLHQIALDPQKFQTLQVDAANWAQQYTLENLRNSIREILEKNWNLPMEEVKGIS